MKRLVAALLAASLATPVLAQGLRRQDPDLDRDGKVSRAERDAATERRFKMVDTNHDGWLSKGEVLQMGQMRQRAN